MRIILNLEINYEKEKSDEDAILSLIHISDDDSILMILKDKEDISRILDVIENW